MADAKPRAFRKSSTPPAIRVEACGVTGNAFEDSYFVDYVDLQLTTGWQAFALDLAVKSYAAGVTSGFALRIDAATNAVPAAVYLNDMVLRIGALRLCRLSGRPSLANTRQA